MTANKLELNDDKTESLLITPNRTSLPCRHPTSIQIGHTDIPCSPQAKIPGVTLCADLSMDEHATNICRSAYLELRRISNIRHYLTIICATKTLVCAFVLSKLDHCNSLLSGSPKFRLDKLQKVHNSAASLIFKARKQDHVKTPPSKMSLATNLLKNTEQNFNSVQFSTFTETSPVYLSELLAVYHPSRQLRSALTTRTFRVLLTKTRTFGERSFSFTGGKWNSLPHDVRR